MSEIKYTRNIVNKLKLLGFEFCYEQDPSDDPDIKYEVWSKGEIEVTIDHAEKYISVALVDWEDIAVNTLYELRDLDRMINKKKVTQ